jgi:hypothetical protein
MKKWLLLTIMCLIAFISYSQPTKTRIEDILNPKKTETEIEKDKLKSRLNSEAELTNSCIDKLFEAKYEIDSLNKKIDSLKMIISNQSIMVNNAKTKEQLATEDIDKEIKQKQFFAKLAVGEGVMIVGGIVAAITGAWVPICIAVGVVELYLLVEGKIQISIKQTKI